ncbi:MAG: hypothetical protein AB7K24_14275 [Gemmataceae bacterium]
MSKSISVPDELADQLDPYKDELPQILALGLREWNARTDTGEFVSLASVLETLASLPTPEEVLTLRPSPSVQAHLEELLEKNRNEGLSPAEKREWDHYAFVEHLVRLAKAQAKLKMKTRD